jgi:phosphate transport system permease protein
MSVLLTLFCIVGLATTGYWLGRRRALVLAGGRRSGLHSLPGYHGLFVALCILLPAVVLLQIGLAIERPASEWMVRRSHSELFEEARHPGLLLAHVGRLARGSLPGQAGSSAERAAAASLVRQSTTARWALNLAALAVAAGGGLLALRRVAPGFRARNWSERIARGVLFACSLVAIATTIGIVLSLVGEAARFFALVPPAEFFFGLDWSPQEAIRADQVGSSGAFGAVPVLVGTLLITTVAMGVAVPVGLMSAIYMAEFADARVRDTAKPLLEILAGVPTVVYGFFAAVTVAPWVRDLGAFLGFETSSQSALAAGVVMGLMIVPFISSLSDDVICAVPQRLRDGARTLGATHAETVVRVVLPAALPGLLSATVLAVSRALGETMIVVMAAGLYARLTVNPFDAVTTVTVQITTVLTGDQQFDSPTTLSSFALALGLFGLTFGLNFVALRVMERYRERYD